MTFPTLFIVRDGTLIEESADRQLDCLEDIRFMPGVFRALYELSQRGFRLVMISDHDGLDRSDGSASALEKCQSFILGCFRSQDIAFHSTFRRPQREKEALHCGRTQAQLLMEHFKHEPFDREGSAVIGDGAAELQLAATLGIRGYRLGGPGPDVETWDSIVGALTHRRAVVDRVTKESEIRIKVNLDREEPRSITTGIGFFDHMLDQLAKHAGFALDLRMRGDLHVDEHHTVEDTAIALGEALRLALGDKAGLARYGFVLPMDEARATVAIDLSGRTHVEFSGQFARELVGTFPTELVPHFFRSFGEGLRAAVHISVRGENTHHMVEACFKAVGRALRQALRREGSTLPSTKGVL